MRDWIGPRVGGRKEKALSAKKVMQKLPKCAGGGGDKETKARKKHKKISEEKNRITRSKKCRLSRKVGNVGCADTVAQIITRCGGDIERK